MYSASQKNKCSTSYSAKHNEKKKHATPFENNNPFKKYFFFYRYRV